MTSDGSRLNSKTGFRRNDEIFKIVEAVVAPRKAERFRLKQRLEENRMRVRNLQTGRALDIAQASLRFDGSQPRLDIGASREKRSPCHAPSFLSTQKRQGHLAV